MVDAPENDELVQDAAAIIGCQTVPALAHAPLPSAALLADRSARSAA